MAEHETEEEQIEALKRWWAEFGNRIMLVLALVICSYGGWQYVDQQQRERAEIASNDYSDMLDILDPTTPRHSARDGGRRADSERRARPKKPT